MAERMRAGGLMVFLMVLAMYSMAHQWTCATAQVHHVVGGDHGWDPSSDVSLWSNGKAFRVGDQIWFTYSAALENVVEVKNREEFESCDVSNPIRMYTDGIDKVSLDSQGSRYFASGSPDSCKKGLKLHVHVLPLSSEDPIAAAAAVAATGPTPSISATLPVLSASLLCGALALLCFIAF